MTQVISHALYSVNAEEVDEGMVYDWFTNNGGESDGWFETAEEAEQDVRSELGLTDDIVVLTRAEYDKLLGDQWRYEELNK